MRRGRINNFENQGNDNEKKNEAKLMEQSLKIVKNNKENVEIQRKKRIASKSQNDKVLNETPKENSKFKKFLVYLLIILAILLVYLYFNFGPLVGISLNRNNGIDEQRKIDIVANDSNIYDSYCSDLLIYSNQKVTTYNSRGNKTWEYQLPSQFTPNIYTKDRFMIISNNSDGKIYLFENKKEIFNTKIDGKIDEIFLDTNGNFAIEYSTNGYKKVIGVYNRNGKNLYNAYLSSEPIINAVLINNAKSIVVCQASTNTFKAGINVSLIDGTKGEEVKNITTIDNNFIYDLTIQGQNIIMLLNDKIIKCNIDTGSMDNIYSFDSDQLMYVSLEKNYYNIITKKLNTENNTNEYTLESNLFDNNKISEFKVNEVPKIFKTASVLNYMIFQEKISVVNKWGIEVKNINIDFPPKNVVIFNNSKSIALVYANKIYVVNL